MVKRERFWVSHSPLSFPSTQEWLHSGTFTQRSTTSQQTQPPSMECPFLASPGDFIITALSDFPESDILSIYKDLFSDMEQ